MSVEGHRAGQPDAANEPCQTTYGRPGLLTLLFGLSLAAALPSDGIIAPPGRAGPVVHAVPGALLGADAVEAVLARPTIAVGSGEIFLREVDRRLNGLVVQLDAFRVTDAPTALVTLGLVTDEPAPTVGYRATTRELWLLAQEAIVNRGAPCEPVDDVGDDAFLALHGDCTAQVAWLTRERLATASVTSLAGDKIWAIASARSLARRVDTCLALDREGWPLLESRVVTDRRGASRGCVTESK